MNRRLISVGCAVAAAGVLAFASQGFAQVKQGKTRPLKTKHMMSALIKPSMTAVNTGLQGSGPADDKGWDALEAHAALLNESGHMLMADGRCPDDVWASSSKAMQDGSQALLAKIQAKDAAGAREAMTAIAGSCKSCHTAHIKK